MMEIYGVTPQMERHMTNVDFFGPKHTPMHSLREEEAANEFIEKGVDFDDTFVYDELEEDTDAAESKMSDQEIEEELVRVAAEDIVKKLVSPREPAKIKNIKKEIKKTKKVVVNYGKLHTFEF
jgi:hypothetical protein